MIDLTYVALLQQKREIEKRNKKAIDYSKSCEENEEITVRDILTDALSLVCIFISIFGLYIAGCCI